MKSQPGLLTALLAASLLPAAAVAQLPSAAAQASIPLKVVTGKPVVDGVFLNGQGPYRFLLDTGSQSNQVDAGLARKLGLAATLQLDLQTPSGPSTVHSGRVSKVSLGQAGASPAEASDQEFLFTRFADLALPPDIRGILGQEFLAHFDYTLDFQHHRLSFGEQTSAASAPTSFRLIFGRMAIPTSLGDLVLDSGAEMLFLFRQSARPASAQVMGANGATMAVAFATAPEVRIGDRRYRPSKAEYHPVPAAEEAGLLPASLFHAIFICNSKKYVVFDPPL